ncbi:DUF4123 domain-containing protein [Marinomonas posidonica]|uniref:DUF4123 domain-containing protein n=1 Tax=Marinomonas posidonica (strain CECT 7376 / NCIMB 14433 / IVIA-Po-181) TaxID=491952 RepID=F6CWW9_MARPP|nr:DUF4123 domain-containing protein [Marinomonas posidonica]AEF55531.1 hypothetical protein Mar181_2498 [Marinomonas posidonica IVIA-Po-181]
MIASETFSLTSEPFEVDVEHYLIVNSVPVSTPPLLADIQRHSDTSDYVALYHKSELSTLMDMSPYVVKVHQDHPLLHQYVGNAEAHNSWSGILLTVSKDVPFESLLSHLRQRLLVSFSEGRKGILHFSNPAVANYFFSETTEQTDTDSWLGPIKQVCWYGPNHSPNQGLWCKIQNSQAISETPSSDQDQAPSSMWLMTASQALAFKQQNIDKALADYFTQMSLSVTDPQQWLTYRAHFHDAEKLGFTEFENIYQYLSLCEKQHTVDQQDDNYRIETETKRLIEQLDIQTVQTLQEDQKLPHIALLLEKDPSYVNG